MFKVVKTLALNDSDPKLSDHVLNQIKKTSNYNKECLSVVNDLIFAHKLDFAFKLYDTMDVSEEAIRKSNLGNPLIRAMVRANVAPEEVIGFCERLESRDSNESAIKTATEMALLHSDIDICRTYLNRMAVDSPLKLHYFYPLIVKCQNEDQMLEVLNQDLSSFTRAS